MFTPPELGFLLSPSRAVVTLGANVRPQGPGFRKYRSVRGRSGAARPDSVPDLDRGFDFLPADVASCHPASKVDLKPRKALSPGHGLCQRASRVAGQPRGAPIRAAWSLMSRQKCPGTVRGRTRITAPRNTRHSTCVSGYALDAPVDRQPAHTAEAATESRSGPPGARHRTFTPARRPPTR